MTSISSDARFLGVDFSALWREVRQPWQGMRQWPLLRWLTPAVPVLLLQADGSQSLWHGDVLQPNPAGSPKARFTALELPEDSVLRRTLSIPVMGEADTATAVALEARTMSPFAAQDLIWGYRTYPPQRGVVQIVVVLVSRKQATQYLAAQAARLQGAVNPEMWVRTDQLSPVVLGGYGESLRESYATRWRRVGYGLFLVVFVLLAAIAITPTAQLRLRAVEAVQSYDAIAQRTAPLVRQREALLQSAEQLGALSQMLADRIEPLRILDKLTQILPDDTSLQSFKLQGTKVMIVGTTVNASTLMQLLGNQPGLHDVRAPAAATRNAGASKETFAIEFSLDPQFFGVVGAAVPLASAPLPEAMKTAVPPPVEPAGKAPPTVATVPVVQQSSAAPRAGGPSFGSSRRPGGPSTPPAPVTPTPKPAQ